jgi:hypothetical protein
MSLGQRPLRYLGVTCVLVRWMYCVLQAGARAGERGGGGVGDLRVGQVDGPQAGARGGERGGGGVGNLRVVQVDGLDPASVDVGEPFADVGVGGTVRVIQPTSGVFLASGWESLLDGGDDGGCGCWCGSGCGSGCGCGCRCGSGCGIKVN